jgi:glycyl-tRNA synthetase
MAKQEDLFKNVVSRKEYGFIFPSSEIYDGLSAVYDYAQNGVELKRTYIILVESDGSNER